MEALKPINFETKTSKLCIFVQGNPHHSSTINRKSLKSHHPTDNSGIFFLRCSHSEPHDHNAIKSICKIKVQFLKKIPTNIICFLVILGTPIMRGPKTVKDLFIYPNTLEQLQNNSPHTILIASHNPQN